MKSFFTWLFSSPFRVTTLYWTDTQNYHQEMVVTRPPRGHYFIMTELQGLFGAMVQNLFFSAKECIFELVLEIVTISANVLGQNHTSNKFTFSPFTFCMSVNISIHLAHININSSINWIQLIYNLIWWHKN